MGQDGKKRAAAPAFNTQAALDAFYRDFPERRKDVFFLDRDRHASVFAALDENDPWLGQAMQAAYRPAPYMLLERFFADDGPAALPGNRIYRPGQYSALNFFKIGPAGRRFQDILLSGSALDRTLDGDARYLPP